jgi:hypothetical protein
MYDSIHFEPGVICKCGKIHKDFQTKDLENALFNYRVTKTYKFETEITKSRKPKKSEQRRIGNCYLPIVIIEHVKWSPFKYLGNIYAYDLCGAGYWIDLCLRIIDGEVTWETKITKR